jgi:hypothetical protein
MDKPIRITFLTWYGAYSLGLLAAALIMRTVIQRDIGIDAVLALQCTGLIVGLIASFIRKIKLFSHVTLSIFICSITSLSVISYFILTRVH